MNPRAPEVIICGNGRIIASAARAPAGQKGAIPVFIKRAVNRWAYQGDYLVEGAFESGPRFEALLDGSNRHAGSVSQIILMRRV